MSVGSVLLLLPHALDPSDGGVQRSTWQMGHDLSRRGWKVSFASLAPDGHQVPAGIPLRFPEKKVIHDRGALERFLAGVLDEFRPSVVVNQVGVPVEPSATLARLRQVRHKFQIIACFHNAPGFFRDHHRRIVRSWLRGRRWLFDLIDHESGWAALLFLHRWRNAHLFRRALARCDRFMLLSPSYVSELRWYVPELDESQLIVVPNGYALPEEPPPVKKEKQLLFVGRLEDMQKNVLMLPELWARVGARLPEWDLHVVGDGPDRQRLEARLAELGLNRVHLHGKQRPHRFFSNASIFVMLSAFEGFPNTLIEAQMHGTVPVVFRSFSAVDWMLNDGKDAVLVPPFDLERFADEIVDLALNEPRLAEMRVAALNNAQRFAEQTVGALWDQILSASEATGAGYGQ